jgi:hypothetical protein
VSLDGFVHDSRGSTGVLYPDLVDWRHEERGKASIAATGAVPMGRRTFEMAGDPDRYAGQYEYQVPVFVVKGSALTRSRTDERHCDSPCGVEDKSARFAAG